MPEAAVEVKITDTEIFQALASRVADAAEWFGRLGDEERAALPRAARQGIQALTGAHAGPPGTGAPGYWGYVVLEWPGPVKTLTFPRAMAAREVAVYDAADGTPITTVEKIIVRASADGWVIAEMTMLADPEGAPVLNGTTVWPDEHGNIRTGVFRYLVAGMRVRP